jgi:hypothetical protein
LDIAVLESVTGSTWTPEFAFIEGLN